MRFTQILLPLLALAGHALAIPASNETFFLKQPDGSTIEVRQRGDELFHVFETADGYILQEDELGYYAYADETGKSSKIYAQDAKKRSPSDIQFLSRLDSKAIFKKLYEPAPRSRALTGYNVPAYAPQERTFPPKNLAKGELIGEFRAIVILVQFQDIKFKSPDPKKLYTDFFNKEGFNEFGNTGSVRDYFIKNSMGKFIPTYDVYGPITLPETRAGYGKTGASSNFYGAERAFELAATLLDLQGGIDFSKYDNNGNSVIDFPIFIFAGVGSNDSPVKEAFWPHQGLLDWSRLQAGVKMGGKYYLNEYSCAAEINGFAYILDSTTSLIQGIGSISHEIGHTLGLPDLYNTAVVHITQFGADSSGLSIGSTQKTLGTWDIMDNGGYNCPTNPFQSCAPPLYSAFERMSLGWLTPTELEDVGPVRLDKIDTNVAYSVTNPKNPDEFFLLEYRTHKNWDKEVPGSGMLIYHIDYDADIWRGSIINANYNHMHVDIIEADTARDARTDAFPGLNKVTEFKKFISWDGDSLKVALYNITESPDSEYVTFTVDIDGRLSSALALSSSSQAIDSSSDSRSIPVAHKAPASNVKVRSHNGSIYIYAPQQVEKTVRIFSPIGALLYEKSMDGSELIVEGIHELRNSNVVLSIIQEHKELFTGILRTMTR